MSTGCPDAELRSAFVDGNLDPARTEVVATHLVSCPTCRADVADLRTYRQLLGRDAAPAPAPDLADRLVSIAGPQAEEPLWTRPFARARTGNLPSRRRRARVRVTAGAVALGALTAVTGLTGYAAGAPAEVPVLADPADEARTEFGVVASRLSLAGSSLTALMLLDSVDPGRLAPTAVAPSPQPAAGPFLAAADASALLRQARHERRDLSGTQFVYARSRGSAVSATAAVTVTAGQGTQVSILDRTGGVLLSRTIERSSSSALGADDLPGVTGAYVLRARTGARVASRAATVVVAVRDGEPVHRWWVDETTGVLLWEEAYDSSGATTAAVGFTAVRFDDEGMISHLAPGLSTTSLSTGFRPGRSEDLDADGFALAPELAGLPLLEVRSDASDDPTTVHLVYGDGLRTLSVLQQRGRLAGRPAGAVWDDQLHAYRHDGAVAWATWPSGDTVLTVTTAGSTELLPAAVSSLPREAAPARTTLARVLHGWSRIVAGTKG